MNIGKVNETIRFMNLFLCAFFLTYYFSLFIGIPSEEAKDLGVLMLSFNMVASFKRFKKFFG